MLLFFLSFVTGFARTNDPRNLHIPPIEFNPQEVERHTLSNGIEVFFVEDHEVPLVDVCFLVKAGKTRVPANQSGLAQILAKMIVEGGSEVVPQRLFQDSLKNFGASFSTHAGTEEATFTLHLLSKHIPVLLPMIVDAILTPALPANQLEVNKGKHLMNYQGRNDRNNLVAGRIFLKLNYGENSPIIREATPATLQSINTETLKEFHRRCYRPSHVMIGVRGDFDHESMVELLENLVGDWQEPDEKTYPATNLLLSPGEPGVYVVNIPGSVQSSIYIGHRGIALNDPRYPESRLLGEIYGWAWFSRLRHQVREERGLAYLVAGHLNTYYDDPGMFSAFCMTKSETTLETSRLILEIMNDLKTKGVTHDELQLAKQSWLASFPSFYEDPGELLLERMDYEGHGYPADFWDQLPDKIEPLTCEDINRFAADLIEPDSLIIVLVGDSTVFDGSASELGEVTIIDPEEY